MSDLAKTNIDTRTVEGFGDEWSRFNQEQLSDETLKQIFDDYFAIFPWDQIGESDVGADIGAGSGRWARIVAPRVGQLYLVDASEEALEVSKHNLRHASNVRFELSSVGDLPFERNSLDFAYSLGVLHHVPDTAAALCTIASKLKSGAPFLVYLYYAFDNRGGLYKMIWKISDAIRAMACRLPYGPRYWLSQAIAASIYWPMARGALLLEFCKLLPSSWPLAYYRDKPFYVMRTDSLDRFGTPLERRFTRLEIKTMLENAGFIEVAFSDRQPFWCAIAKKA